MLHIVAQALVSEGALDMKGRICHFTKADRPFYIQGDDICNSESKAMGPPFRHRGDRGIQTKTNKFCYLLYNLIRKMILPRNIPPQMLVDFYHT